MFCKNCGNQVDPNAAICVKCGHKLGEGSAFCHNCGNPLTPGAEVCMSCGYAVAPKIDPNTQKSKLVAGLLGILLGGLGIHNFYLGYTGKGIAQIILSFCCGIGCIWGLIEGILLLVGKIDKDADGVPLGE